MFNKFSYSRDVFQHSLKVSKIHLQFYLTRKQVYVYNKNCQLPYRLVFLIIITHHIYIYANYLISSNLKIIGISLVSNKFKFNFTVVDLQQEKMKDEQILWVGVLLVAKYKSFLSFLHTSYGPQLDVTERYLVLVKLFFVWISLRTPRIPFSFQ